MAHMFRLIGMVILLVLAGAWVGCTPSLKGAPAGMDVRRSVPSPIDLLLPKTLDIHSFTQIEVFDQSQGGIRARVKARDAYGDGTKAFGRFRFELYAFQPHQQNKRGRRLADWEIDVSQSEQNLVYWDRHTGSYEFKLGWNQRVPTGQRLVLVAVFNSEFTPRLTAEREIVAGE